MDSRDPIRERAIGGEGVLEVRQRPECDDGRSARTRVDRLGDQLGRVARYPGLGGRRDVETVRVIRESAPCIGERMRIRTSGLPSAAERDARRPELVEYVARDQAPGLAVHETRAGDRDRSDLDRGIAEQDEERSDIAMVEVGVDDDRESYRWRLTGHQRRGTPAAGTARSDCRAEKDHRDQPSRF